MWSLAEQRCPATHECIEEGGTRHEGTVRNTRQRDSITLDVRAQRLTHWTHTVDNTPRGRARGAAGGSAHGAAVLGLRLAAPIEVAGYTLWNRAFPLLGVDAAKSGPRSPGDGCWNARSSSSGTSDQEPSRGTTAQTQGHPGAVTQREGDE